MPALFIYFVILLIDKSTYGTQQIWTKSSINNQETFTNEYSHSYLYKDEISGCLCRFYPQNRIVCFGRETCQHFPNQLINVTMARKFKLKASSIVELNSNDFEKFINLEILEIEGNDRLTTIKNRTFVSLISLKKLSISGNKQLNHFNIDSFSGLIKLKELLLINNNFVEITEITRSLSPVNLPALQKLELSQNNFVRIDKNAFKTLDQSLLKELNLILCQIEFIHPETLRYLRNLAILRLGENTFFNTSVITDLITTTINFGIPLERLNLYSVGFRKQPPGKLMEIIGKSNITTLNLARNQFEVLTPASFPLMENLEILDLRECLILEIHNDSFINLTNLRILLLSGNRLTTIPDGVLLNQLTYLDLQDNSGQQSSKIIDFSLYRQRFVHMENLENLDLSFNQINAIYNNSFIGLENLKVLGLKNSSIFYIANASFAVLKNLKFLNLENNYFMKNWEISKDMFNGLKTLEILLLNGNNLQFFHPEIFQNLKTLQHLGLERNNLLEISPASFSNFPQLKSLDLSYNQLHSWQKRLFTNNQCLKILNLRSNQLMSLTGAMWEDFRNLSELELDNNQFVCNCTIFEIFQIYNDQNVLKLLKNQTIYCSYPDTKINTTLPDFYRQNPEICNNPIKLITIIILVVILITITIISVTLFYYRWHLRYWLFLTRLYLIRKGVIIKKRKNYANNHNFIYDAFVSYSNEDRNFVVRLVGMLENYPPNIRLCVYERDFQVGTLITQNVLDCISKSRKILLIISNSYAKSQWCRWETQIVENHNLFLNNNNNIDNYQEIDDKLILIKLGTINRELLTPTLKFLLKTRIYLQWDSEVKKQEVFWNKLRQVLAPCGGIVESTHL